MGRRALGDIACELARPEKTMDLTGSAASAGLPGEQTGNGVLNAGRPHLVHSV